MFRKNNINNNSIQYNSILILITLKGGASEHQSFGYTVSYGFLIDIILKCFFSCVDKIVSNYQHRFGRNMSNICISQV
jgi:hypothetical protein